MKKTQKRKPLALDTQTLRTLDTDDLRTPAGGLSFGNTCKMTGCTCTCGG